MMGTKFGWKLRAAAFLTAGLIASGGPVDVDGDHHRVVLVLGEPAGEFGGRGRFARALEADDHNDRRRLIGEAQAGGMRAEELDELFVDDLDDLLRRVEGGEDFLAERFFLDRLDEALDHFEVDVGFEEGDADFAQGGFHVLRGEFALAAQVFEDPLQFVAKVIEHGLPPSL